MSIEGEFKKRFGALFFDNLTGKVHNGKDFFDILDEARKDFPLWGTSQDQIDWFVKYFGEISEESLKRAWLENQRWFEEAGATGYTFEKWKKHYGFGSAEK